MKNSGFTLMETCIALALALAGASVVAMTAMYFVNASEGRRAGDALRAVEAAQGLYFSNNPNGSVATVTAAQLASVMPNSPGSNLNVLLPTRLAGQGVTINFNAAPPVLVKSGSVYDPSGNSSDGRWDAGK